MVVEYTSCSSDELHIKVEEILNDNGTIIAIVPRFASIFLGNVTVTEHKILDTQNGVR